MLTVEILLAAAQEFTGRKAVRNAYLAHVVKERRHSNVPQEFLGNPQAFAQCDGKYRDIDRVVGLDGGGIGNWSSVGNRRNDRGDQ